MATVMDVDPDLRALARRVPPDKLQHLGPLELTLRCEEASALLAEADGAGPGHKADRLRHQAKRVLGALTPAGYSLAFQTLGEEIRQAELSGADRRAAVLRAEMAELDRANPQPSPDRVVAHVQAELAQLNIPSAPQRSAMARRFGRDKRKSKK